MGFLSDFRKDFIGAIHFVTGSIRDIVVEGIDIITEEVIAVAEDIRYAFRAEIPTYKRKRRLRRSDKANIKRRLRKQWLELGPSETEIEGEMYEGELYYETPK